MKRPEPIGASRPNASGQTKPLPAPPRSYLGLCSLVTVLALQRSREGYIPVQQTAWYRDMEPTFADCLALVRQHLWRARYLVNSAPEAEIMQFPREVLDLLIHGVPLAA